MQQLRSASIPTGLTITNPLVLYRALLTTKRIDPDPAQHRLALDCRNCITGSKIILPKKNMERDSRLKAINPAVGPVPKDEEQRPVAVPGHPLRRNPLFSHLFARNEERETLALTRVLTSHEAAMNLDLPKSMLLHGEVGTGKSMLVDLLADSLPNQKKRRWHFNTFMLETLARLEQLRRSRSDVGSAGGDSEHSLLWLARDMIDKSPILFLDEFQLPDRAAGKILSNLFPTFFQFVGVLIATSNRIPDELAKASGIDYAAPSRGGLVRKGLSPLGNMSALPANNEYGRFVEVLKARCEIYNLSRRDWRRREAEEMGAEAFEIAEAMREGMIEGFVGLDKMGPGEQIVLNKLAESTWSKSPSELEQSSREEPNILKSMTPRKYLFDILRQRTNLGDGGFISSTF
jgi:protein AFG1